MAKKHYCAECRAGENPDVPADVYLTGYTDRPYRAYVCEDHVDILCTDWGEDSFKVKHL